MMHYSRVFTALSIMVYQQLLKTGSLDNAIREFSLAYPSWYIAMIFHQYFPPRSHNSLHLERNSRIFVLGHYLFLKAHSFLRVSVLATDNVRGQIPAYFLAKWRPAFIYLTHARQIIQC